MTSPGAIVATPAGVRLSVRVIPRSPRTNIDGVRDGRLLVRVTAPPVDDAANEALVMFIARALGVSRSAVRIVGGAKARNKTIDVTGIDAASAASRLT
jgi:uncharacterized protein (TIGR00251 family)